MKHDEPPGMKRLAPRRPHRWLAGPCWLSLLLALMVLLAACDSGCQPRSPSDAPAPGSANREAGRERSLADRHHSAANPATGRRLPGRTARRARAADTLARASRLPGRQAGRHRPEPVDRHHQDRLVAAAHGQQQGPDRHDRQRDQDGARRGAADEVGGATIVYEDMDDATPATGAWDAGKEAENANQAVVGR